MIKVFKHRKKIHPPSTLIFALYSAAHRNQAVFESPKTDLSSFLRQKEMSILKEQSGLNNWGF